MAKLGDYLAMAQKQHEQEMRSLELPAKHEIEANVREERQRRAEEIHRRLMRERVAAGWLDPAAMRSMVGFTPSATEIAEMATMERKERADNATKGSPVPQRDPELPPELSSMRLARAAAMTEALGQASRMGPMRRPLTIDLDDPNRALQSEAGSQMNEVLEAKSQLPAGPGPSRQEIAETHMQEVVIPRRKEEVERIKQDAAKFEAVFGKRYKTVVGDL